VIIDTDAGCEVDDQYAIALALLCPERLEVEGFVAQHWGSPDTLDRTVEETERVIERAGMAGEFPVLRGAPAIQWFDLPTEGDGVDFIVERAMSADADDPLYVVSLGAATNIASAFMTEPDIAERIVSLWHTRSQWPLRGANANILTDLKAARRMFLSDLPLIMFDTGTYLRWTMEESEQRIRPHGPLGEYLHALRESAPAFSHYGKGIYDLGDVAFLVDPSLGEYDVTELPALARDSTFDFSRPQGRGVRVHHIDRRGALDLLCGRLSSRFPVP
jgi:inosine-uridine nucleoside N-ribohydrolase